MEFPPPQAVTPLIHRDVAGTSKLGRSWAGCVLLSHLQAGKPTLPHGATQGRKEGAVLFGNKVTSSLNTLVFLPSSLCIWPHDDLILKASDSQIFPVSEAVQQRSTGHLPKHFTSFGYYFTTLARKKDAQKKRKIQTETLLQSKGFTVHWALPRRAAVHWSSDLNCLDSYKEPNKLSWLQLHEPAATRDAEQTKRRIKCPFSLCRTGYKLPIFQLVFWRVGSPELLQLCWKAFQRRTR